MRRTKIFIFTLVSTVLLGACKQEFLDSKPLTQLTEAEYFNTSEEIETALVGVYNAMYRSTTTLAVQPSRWDDTANAGMGKNDGLASRVQDHFDMTIDPGQANLYQGDWNTGYTTLFRVNLLLQKLNNEAIVWSNPKRKAEIEAELRFIRAQTYFTLVRMFERVVLLTEPTAENLPQSEPDETYSLIADDLLFAAGNGATEVSSRAKATVWAAKSLIARVYLFYTGVYNKPDLVGKITKAQALQGLEDVITSGHFELISEFKNLWVVPSATLNSAGNNWDLSYAGKDNREVVFAHRHNITPNGLNNPMTLGIGMRSKGYPPYGFGWGGLTVRPEFYQSFESNDTRREASIVALIEEGYATQVNNSDQRDYTGYTTKKYIPLILPDGSTDYVTSEGGSWQNNQHWDYVVIRYADVLLMAAELGSPNAQQYFNSVRSRAGLQSIPVTFDNIMKERGFEFAFEGLRYFDLLRQGINVLADALEYDAIVLDGGAPYRKVIKRENIIKKRGFMQIPLININISNSVLEQNPGWL